MFNARGIEKNGALVAVRVNLSMDEVYDYHDAPPSPEYTKAFEEGSKSAGPARPHSIKETFAEGDRVSHKKFGEPARNASVAAERREGRRRPTAIIAVKRSASASGASARLTASSEPAASAVWKASAEAAVPVRASAARARARWGSMAGMATRALVIVKAPGARRSGHVAGSRGRCGSAHRLRRPVAVAVLRRMRFKGIDLRRPALLRALFPLTALTLLLAGAGCRRRAIPSGPPPEPGPVAEHDAGPHDDAGTEGTEVKLEVAMMTGTVTRESPRGDGGAAPPRYMMVALPLDAPSLKAIDELRGELEKLAADVGAVKPGARPGDLTELLARHDALAKKVEAAKVVPSEGVMVELSGFEPARMRLSWEEVSCMDGFCAPPPLKLPGLQLLGMDPCAWPTDDKKTTECVAAADERIGKLAAFDPPPLDEALPVLPSMAFARDGALIVRYNRLVPRFNKEVTRRNAAVAASLPGKVARLGRLAAAAGGVRWTLHGVARPVSSPAGRLYRSRLGSAPARQVAEAPAPGARSFAAATYATTRVCFTSLPVDAAIVLDKVVARTPACVEALPPGEDADLHLELPGRAPARLETARVLASPANVTEVHCVLAKNGSAGKSGCSIVF